MVCGGSGKQVTAETAKTESKKMRSEFMLANKCWLGECRRGLNTHRANYVSGNREELIFHGSSLLTSLYSAKCALGADARE